MPPKVRNAEQRAIATEITTKNPTLWEGYRVISTNDNGRFNRIQLSCRLKHKYGTIAGEMRRGHQCPNSQCVNDKKSATHLRKDENRVINFFGTEAMVAYTFIGVSFSGGGEGLYVEFTCPEGHTNKSAWRTMQAGTRCGHRDCIDALRVQTLLKRSKKKMDKLFSSIGYENHKIIDVFYKPCKNKNLSFVTFTCPEGHVTTSRTNSVLNAKTKCSNMICRVQRQMQNAFSTKEHFFANGKRSLYMGYEYFLLELLATVQNVEDIQTTLDVINQKEYCHMFRYEFKGFVRIYLPDIIVSNRNMCRYYEVKSWWTLNFNGKSSELEQQNLQKWKYAAMAEGAIFDVFVFVRKGTVSCILRIFPDQTCTLYTTFAESENDSKATGSFKVDEFKFKFGNDTDDTDEEHSTSVSDIISGTELFDMEEEDMVQEEYSDSDED